MKKTTKEVHLLKLLRRDGMPHEVIALTDGVGVMDSVVTEDPSFEHVHARQERKLAHHPITALA